MGKRIEDRRWTTRDLPRWRGGAKLGAEGEAKEIGEVNNPGIADSMP